MAEVAVHAGSPAGGRSVEPDLDGRGAGGLLLEVGDGVAVAVVAAFKLEVLIDDFLEAHGAVFVLVEDPHAGAHVDDTLLRIGTFDDFGGVLVVFFRPFHGSVVKYFRGSFLFHDILVGN